MMSGLVVRKMLVIVGVVVVLSVGMPLQAYPPATQPAAGVQPAATQPGGVQPGVTTSSEVEEPSGPAMLAIRGIQSTPDGESVVGDAVTVEIFHRGQVINKLEGKLDENGVVIFEDLPLEMGFQPLVNIIHNDVPYSLMGELMDAGNPQQSLDIKVYESTDKQPAWTIGMRRIEVKADEDGLRFVEVVVVNNPADRAWVVPHEAEEGAEHHTVFFMLPTTMRRPQIIKGFDDCCTRLTRDGKLANLKPLVPGQTEYRYAYTIPAHGDHVHGVFKVTANTDRLVLMADAGSYGIEPPMGLIDQGEIEMHNRKVRYYKAEGLVPGEELAVEFSGVDVTAKAKEQESEGVKEGSVKEVKPTPTSKIVVGLISATILIVAGFITIFLKPGKASGEAEQGDS